MSGLVVVGTRTTRRHGARGHGLAVYATGGRRWQQVGELRCENPSFVIAGPTPPPGVGDPRQRLLYAVHGDGHTVSLLALAPDGTLTRRQEQECGGTNPVHLLLTDDRSDHRTDDDRTDDGGTDSARRLVVVNHSGSVVTLPVRADGHLDSVTDRLDITGTPGPHRDQPHAKPHHVVALPGSDLLLVADKGLDEVLTVRVGRAGPHEVSRTRLREGSGPRHLAVRPRGDVAYTVDELSSTVTVLAVEPGGVTRPVEVHSTLPPRDVRDSRAAEIALSPDGRRLYASNRSGAGDATPGGPGSDTIAVYDVADDGSLTPRGHLTTGGIRPRYFAVREDALYVAHERSDTIVRIGLDADGTPHQPQPLASVGSPVSLLFL